MEITFRRLPSGGQSKGCKRSSMYNGFMANVDYPERKRWTQK